MLVLTPAVDVSLLLWLFHRLRNKDVFVCIDCLPYKCLCVLVLTPAVDVSQAEE